MSAASVAHPSWSVAPGATPALSLRQPWAWAVLRTGKRLENRVAWRSCKYRGPIWIHAANWPRGPVDALRRGRADVDEYLDAVEAMLDMAENTSAATRASSKGATREDDVVVWDLHTSHREILRNGRGGVVGSATVIDVVSGPIDLARAISQGIVPESQRAWYMGGLALVLDDVRPLPAEAPVVECRGALGLFGLPPDVEEKLRSIVATPVAPVVPLTLPLAAPEAEP